MKNPAHLPRDQLIKIVVGLQQILYGKQRPDGSWIYNVDKEWSGADVCEATAELLGQFDLAPQGDADVMDAEREGAPIEDPALIRVPWRCDECGRRQLVSYEDLALVGSPLCSDCDVDMTLLTPWEGERASLSEEPQEDIDDV